MTAIAARHPGPRDARQHAVHIAIACLMAATGAASACRPAATREAEPPATITIGVPSLDAPIGSLLFTLTQVRLVGLDQAGVVQPAVLERWTVSDDHRTWTVTVRDGVRQHDGRIATAADVVGRMRRAVDNPDRGPGLWDVQAVDQVGAREVRIRLSRPSSLLFETLSLVQAVPAGPYDVRDPDAPEPELHAVAGTALAAGAIEAIKVRRYDTPRAAVAALLRDDIDVLYEVPTEARALLNAEGGVRLFPNVKPYVITLGLNHRHPVLKRRAVRLAMNAAIDRGALVAQAAGGVGVPAADMIWYQHWSHPHADDAAVLRVDRARATRLLDEAGLRSRTMADGAIEPRFRVSCLVLQDAMMQRVAGRLRQAYAQVGIALDLQALPLDAFAARLESGRFDAYVSPVVAGYGLTAPYVDFSRHRKERVTDHGYTGAAAAAERVRAATTREGLITAVHELHRVLIDDPPAVSLFWQETARAVGRRVTVPGDPSGDVLGSLTRWFVRSPAT